MNSLFHLILNLTIIVDIATHDVTTNFVIYFHIYRFIFSIKDMCIMLNLYNKYATVSINNIDDV